MKSKKMNVAFKANLSKEKEKGFKNSSFKKRDFKNSSFKTKNFKNPGLLLRILYFYQKKISPKFFSRCIYRPTCSEYMVQAVKKFGSIKGFILGVKRLLRCNQFHNGGVDKIPEKFSDAFLMIRLVKRIKKI